MSPPDNTEPRKIGELTLRILSAAVLIPLGLFVVWFGGWWLAVACAVFALIMGYEWSAMSRSIPAWAMMAASAIAPLAFQIGGWAYAIGAVILALLIIVLTANVRTRAALGLLYTAAPPTLLLVLREGGWDGQSAALIFMATVWASDVGAYFTGRALGGPALSPKDSPNKTWSGALGGVICCMICGTAAATLLGAPYLPWIITGALISVVAQFGDLAESQVKRRFGVKDASGLVPGHGGVMDRVDGLGAVCVATVPLFLVSPDLIRLLGLSG